MWEQATRIVEKITGWSRPSRDQLAGLIRQRKAHAFRFRDDGIIPNHPRWPLIVYRSVVRFPASLDPAAVLEDLFENNGWGNSWRDGIYDYVHYHSRIHEVLGIAGGAGKVQFGGKRGRTLRLKAGDVVVLPAGTGHQCLSSSADFSVVGAYPPGPPVEITRATPRNHERALKTIPNVKLPKTDPVLGADGPLVRLWNSSGVPVI